MAIPHVFHQIWLGEQPLPDEFKRFAETWRSLHPDWEMILWTDESLPSLENAQAYTRATSLSGKSNIARYEILLRFGGVYVDTDFECLKSLEPLLEGVECFVARQRDDLVNNAIIGAVPDHPFLRDLVGSLDERVRDQAVSDLSIMQSGPYYLTEILQRHPEVTVFSASQFYPYDWHERWRRYERFPAAYAVHHWSLSSKAHILPKPKQLGNGLVPCLSVIIRTCDDGLRLEWVLEGLRVQTVMDFEVIVISGTDDSAIKQLVERFKPYLDISHYARARRKELRLAEAGNLGLNFARAERTLFLDGDCLPDPDVVEAHAVFGGAAFVPFGFRRIYPASKLYRFVRPLDYDALKKHALPDPRCAKPPVPFYGDWRDVACFCLSAPTDVLCEMGGFDEKLKQDDQDLPRRLSQQKYRLLPMLKEGYVTHLNHPCPF